MIDMLPKVRHELSGWTLLWARLRLQPGAEAALQALFASRLMAARRRWNLDTLAQEPTVAAVRTLFRQAGCDPTRYRPSSEALLRRLLKGEDLPSIHPAVDVNNLLSIALAVPACVMDVSRVQPPLVLRAGRPGEHMLSMRGDFDLAGKPALADEEGVFGTPITDSERVKVRPDTTEVMLVVYLPAERDLVAAAHAILVELLAAAPVGDILAAGFTP